MRHPPWRFRAAFPEDKPAGMPDAHPDKKKAWDRAMKADPEWRAFVEKKRAEEKNTQANPVFQGRALGFFVAENQLVNDAFEIQKPVKIDQKNSEIDHEHSAIDHDHSMFPQTSYDPLHARWLVDTGAQVHICNNRRLFVEFQKTTSSIRVEDTKTMVEGIGTVSICGVSPGNEAPLRMDLFNVKYSPGFHTNIIAHGVMFKKSRSGYKLQKELDRTRRHPTICYIPGSRSPLASAAEPAVGECCEEVS
jgi:hypothetical protein